MLEEIKDRKAARQQNGIWKLTLELFKFNLDQENYNALNWNQKNVLGLTNIGKLKPNVFRGIWNDLSSTEIVWLRIAEG